MRRFDRSATGERVALPFPTKLRSRDLSQYFAQPVLNDCTGLREIERVVAKQVILMDSYRNEQEKVNLLYWQLTCECFFTPSEWSLFSESRLHRDYDLFTSNEAQISAGVISSDGFETRTAQRIRSRRASHSIRDPSTWF